MIPSLSRFALALTFISALWASRAAAQSEVDLWLGTQSELPAAAVPVVTELRPESTVVWSGEVLRRHGYRTLGEALADLVGIDRQGSSQGPRYAVRGVPAGVVLLIDGVPQVVDGERDSLDVDAGLDLYDVERIEVVRGPVSAINGLGALAGVVRVVTRRPGLSGVRAHVAGTWLGERELGGEATARQGEVTLRAVALHREGPSRLWRLRRVPIRFIEIGGAVLPATKVNAEVVPEDDAATVARLAATYRELTADAALAYTDTHTPLSSFSHGLLDRGPDQRQARERSRLRLMWRRRLGSVHVDAALYGARHVGRDRIVLYPPLSELADQGRVNIREESQTGGLWVRADVALARDHRLALGVFADATRLEAFSNVIDPANGQLIAHVVEFTDRTLTATAAGEYQGDFGSGWHLTGGFVGELRTAFGAAVAPRLALIYVPTSIVSVSAAYAEGIRAPDRFQMASLSQAVVAGRIAGARGNDRLRPERTRTGEVATRVEFLPGLRSELNLYLARHEGALVPRAEGAFLVPDNRAPRLIAGGELQVTAEPWPGRLRLQGAVGTSRTVSGARLATDLLSVAGHAIATPSPAVELGLRARAGWRYHGLVRNHPALVDAFASYGPANEALRVRLAVTNLFSAYEASEDLAAPPGVSQVLIAGPARAVSLLVEGRW